MVSHKRRPNSDGQYSSHPSSPTYVTLNAKQGTEPTASCRAVMHGKAWLDGSVEVRGCRIGGAAGPQTPMHASDDMTSSTYTEPTSRMWCRIQYSSFLSYSAPRTMPDLT